MSGLAAGVFTRMELVVQDRLIPSTAGCDVYSTYIAGR